MRRRVARQSAVLVPLNEILEDGQWDTVMITANNRVSVFDVRHAYDDPNRLINLDHLDIMNGSHPPSRRRQPLRRVALLRATYWARSGYLLQLTLSYPGGVISRASHLGTREMKALKLSGRRGLKWRALPLIEFAFRLAGRQ